MSELIRAAMIRALRTAIDYIIGSIPAGVVVTPAMIENFEPEHARAVVLAWLATGIVTVLVAFLWGVRTGLPEVDPAIEATDEDMEGVKVEPYDVQDYDDLFIDEGVEDGEDTVEQEE